ncbi:hypothetical protein RF55_24029, partial [Lasius niger]
MEISRDDIVVPSEVESSSCVVAERNESSEDAIDLPMEISRDDNVESPSFVPSNRNESSEDAIGLISKDDIVDPAKEAPSPDAIDLPTEPISSDDDYDITDPSVDLWSSDDGYTTDPSVEPSCSGGGVDDTTDLSVEPSCSGGDDDAIDPSVDLWSSDDGYTTDSSVEPSCSGGGVDDTTDPSVDLWSSDGIDLPTEPSGSGGGYTTDPSVETRTANLFRVVNAIDDKIYIGITVLDLTRKMYDLKSKVNSGLQSRLHNHMRNLGIHYFRIEHIDTITFTDHGAMNRIILDEITKYPKALRLND